MKHWSAIVLAAGRSSRFGAEDKLLADLHGKPVLAWVLDALGGLDLHQTILVTRPEFPVIDRPGIDIVTNPSPDAGMGDTLSLGSQALKPFDGAFVVLGDMPLIDTSMLKEMRPWLDEYDIVAPVFNGRFGQPVLFGPACLNALISCSGDIGARNLLESNLYRIYRFSTITFESQIDIDTLFDLHKLKKMNIF